MRYSFMDPSKRFYATVLLVLGAVGVLWLKPIDAPETIMMWVSGAGFGVGLAWWILRLSFLAQTKLKQNGN